MSLFARKPFEVGCRIEVEHSGASLHAHVELDGDVALEPGDRVRVLGPPVILSFGQSLVERRRARVSPANAFERAWTRFLARFELAELYEVSFSPRRIS